MDAAAYDSTDNLIIGIRGSRLYKCNATTGAIITTSDFRPLAQSPASIVWDSGINKCFAVAYNTIQSDVASATARRTLYTIDPNTLAVGTTYQINTLFVGVGFPGNNTGSTIGIARMRNVSGTIWGVGWNGVNSWTIFKFLASNPATNSFFGAGGNNTPTSFAYANVGGASERIYWCEQDLFDWIGHSFSGGAAGGIAYDAARSFYAIEWAPVQQRLYVTAALRYVYVYSVGPGTLQATIDTGRANFNGISIVLNSVDGLLYAAGGIDNTVAVIDPATNLVTMKTGFDLPYDFVFTATKKFAVQQGAVGLKEIV